MSIAGSEITRRARITDYLMARGVELRRSGSRHVCLCPLHQEQSPSFNVGEFPDGGQWFHCFGCGEHGSIIKLKALLDGTSAKDAFEALAIQHQVDTTSEPFSRHVEPLPEDVMRNFGISEMLGLDIANYVLAFMQADGGTEDAVDRCCRLYQRVDEMIELGDIPGLIRLRQQAAELLITDGPSKRRRFLVDIPDEYSKGTPGNTNTAPRDSRPQVTAQPPNETKVIPPLQPFYTCPADETPNTTEIFRTRENHESLDDYEYIVAYDATLKEPDDGWDL